MTKSLFGRGGFKREASVLTPVVDFHPGHYYKFDRNKLPLNTHERVGWNGWSDITQTWSNHTSLDRLIAHPIFVGGVLPYNWYELEAADGSAYNWDLVDRYFDALKANNKRFMLQFEIRSFDTLEDFVPTYLQNSTYANGWWEYSGNVNGRNLSLWNQPLKDRLSALFTAIGNRYNSDPLFEGLITCLESAAGVPVNTTPTAAQETAHYEGLLEVTLAAKAAFPNKNVLALMNYCSKAGGGNDDTQMATLIATMRANGVGIGYPDTRIDDPGLNHNMDGQTGNKGIYYHMRHGNGVTPNAPSVQPKNWDYTGRFVNDPLYGHNNPTATELYNDALSMNPNYILWTRVTAKEDTMYALLDTLPQPAGGLITTPPTGYASVNMS